MDRQGIIANEIKNIILGLLLGLLITINGICKEKDKMINLLGRIKSPQIEQQSEIPKNLPVITIK